MQQQTTLSVWCERIIEAGWLLALSLIPLYFNLLSSRHFEPDKSTTLRAFVLVMAAFAIIRTLEQLATTPTSNRGESSASGNPLLAVWERLNAIPLALPVLFYAVVFLFTTATSIVPRISFWGSYQRLQGTYTNLSYVALFVLIISTMRRREQMERMITVILLTGFTVGSYGVIQHLDLDPLPWKGDVITRVASTMGNAIFVAAYLIMVVPLALYRLIVDFTEAARTSSPSNSTSNPLTDVLWSLAYVLLIFGSMALLLGVIKFGAAVRTPDFRYWWVLPGAISVATALWYLVSAQPHSRESRVPFWPGILFLTFVGLLALFYNLGAGSPDQLVDTKADRATDWWVWIIASTVSVFAFYILSLVTPRRISAGSDSRLMLWLRVVGAFILVGVLVTAIFLSQSRGPWLGLGAGLFIFFTFLFWQAARQAASRGATQLAQRMRIATWVWLGLSLTLFGFLLVFNLSDAPFFAELRTKPYIGRLGVLFDTRYGTGRVRSLIWNGDQFAGGARALITSDPLRSVIGWGPESMFVAFNRFYPPSLVQVESRGASPDRSHEALLDELVTKGVIGLISYLFVLLSFLGLAWRLMNQSSEWRWQVFFIACLGVVTSHFVEGLTGIPIVSTLMMLWVVLGMTVVGGLLAGHYTLSAAPVWASEHDESESSLPDDPKADERPTAPSKAKGGRRSSGTRAAPSSVRTGASRVSHRSTANQKQGGVAALILYAVLLIMTLGATWQLNLRTVLADMYFQAGKTYADQKDAGLKEQIVSLDYFLKTVRNNRDEDFYYLNLGRTLMQIAEYRRTQDSAERTSFPPRASDKQRAQQVDQQVKELLQLDNLQDILGFVQEHSGLEIMNYAESVLERARVLNPLNKDHYANLARINNFWYSWTKDLKYIEASADWYRQANEIAPQDVGLLNESASVHLMLGNLKSADKQTTAAKVSYQQAQALLERAYRFEPTYGDTLAHLGETYRLQGMLPQATDLYTQAVKQDPHALDQFLERIIASLKEKPELLTKLRDVYVEKAGWDPRLQTIRGMLSVRIGDMQDAVKAYHQAAKSESTNLEYRRNYTIVLSDTRDYDEALSEARKALKLAQSQKKGEELIGRQFEYLVAFLENKAAGRK